MQFELSNQFPYEGKPQKSIPGVSPYVQVYVYRKPGGKVRKYPLAFSTFSSWFDVIKDPYKKKDLFVVFYSRVVLFTIFKVRMEHFFTILQIHCSSTIV